MLSDIHGVSGRAIIEALIAGERHPKVPAPGWPKAGPRPAWDPGRGRRRAFHRPSRRLARMVLDQIDDLSARIDTVTGLLDEAIAAVPRRLAQVPSVDAATGEFTTATWATHRGRTDLCHTGGGPDTARAVTGDIGWT